MSRLGSGPLVMTPAIYEFFEGRNPAYLAATGEPDMPVISGAHMEGFVDTLKSLWAHVREGKYLDPSAGKRPDATRLDSADTSEGNHELARSGPSDA